MTVEKWILCEIVDNQCISVYVVVCGCGHKGWVVSNGCKRVAISL